MYWRIQIYYWQPFIYVTYVLIDTLFRCCSYTTELGWMRALKVYHDVANGAQSLLAGRLDSYLSEEKNIRYITVLRAKM